jgi:hypothetical protein
MKRTDRQYLKSRLIELHAHLTALYQEKQYNDAKFEGVRDTLNTEIYAIESQLESTSTKQK